MLKSVSENLKKNTVLTVKINNTVINLKKNAELFILCSSELSNFKDNNTTTVSIK